MASGFSPLAVQLLRDRPSSKKLGNPTHVGLVGDEGGGDYVVAEFEVAGGIVKDFGYRCNGCPTTIACCELLGRLAIGAQLDRLSELSGGVLSKLLGEVPEGKGHIPGFVARAISTFKKFEMVGIPIGEKNDY